MKQKTRKTVALALAFTGILLISLPAFTRAEVGSGDASMEMNGTVLTRYTGNATSVTIPSGCTEIGKGAFSGNKTVETLLIDGDVKKIDSSAFEKCSALKTVVIGNAVTEIGDSAFCDDERLNSVMIGANVNKIGSAAFGGCDSLVMVNVSNANTSIRCKKGAVYADGGSTLCQVLAGRAGETYTMPDTVTKVQPYAFWGCDKLKSASISGGLTKITDQAFCNCTGLESMTIPTNITEIQSWGFANDTNLKEVLIPISVLTIHDTAFENCPNLKIVTLNGSQADTFAQTHKIEKQNSMQLDRSFDWTVENNNPDSLGSDSPEAQKNNSSSSSSSSSNTSSTNSSSSNSSSSNSASNNSASDNSASSNSTSSDNSTSESTSETQESNTQETVSEPTLVVPSTSSTLIGNDVVYNTGDIDTLISGEMGKSYVVAGNAMVLMNNSTMKVHYGDDYGSSYDGNAVSIIEGTIPKYTVYDNQIAEKAYYQSDLSYYVIPDGVTRIGALAFARSNVQSVVIPNTVTSIGYGAFYACENLEYLTIPESVTEIECYAFDRTKWKENWLQSGDTSPFYITGDGILLFYKGSTGVVTIPEGVKQIASGAFRDHKEIKSVALPDSLEVIGEEAFMGCTALSDVSGGSQLQKMKDRAFSGCPLDTVRIPATVTEMGLGAIDVSEQNRQTTFGAVFMGDQIPSVTQSSSSKHLSNQKARVHALEGVDVAVLWKRGANLEGSLLEDSDFGFSGYICSISREATSGSVGILELEKVVDAKNHTSLPESVWVYGNRYIIEDPQNVLSSSEGTGETGYDFEADGNYTNAITQIPATDSTEAFVIRDYDDKEAEKQLIASLQDYFGDDLPDNVSTFSIMAYDESGSMPITQLDEYAMKITKDLPVGVSGNNLYVVTRDQEGQLEAIDYQVSDTGRKVTFEASHFSPFAIFQLKSASIANGEAGIEPGLDADPDGNAAEVNRASDTEISLFTVICVMVGTFLLIVAFALAFTKKFHKTI